MSERNVGFVCVVHSSNVDKLRVLFLNRLPILPSASDQIATIVCDNEDQIFHLIT